VATVTRTIKVVAGVFAPGHLGELTRHVPFELVDAVLTETRTTERRLRELPSRVGIYFVLALGLFPQVGLREGVGQAGRRPGWPAVAVSVGQGAAGSAPPPRGGPGQGIVRGAGRAGGRPAHPGVRFGRYRTVAFDGCTSIKVADSDRNRRWLGKMKAALGVTGYPMVELMTLVETGTRALLGAVFGPPAIGETDYARTLLPLLRKDMLVLADRGFDAGEFLTELADTGAKFLVRLRSNRRLPVVAMLTTARSCPGSAR
jgi:hypothetical protein